MKSTYKCKVNEGFDGDTQIVLRLRATDVRSFEIVPPVKATVSDAEAG
jgi:hypothetical protein